MAIYGHLRSGNVDQIGREGRRRGELIEAHVYPWTIRRIQRLCAGYPDLY